MRRLIVLVAIVLVTTGCTRPAAKIATHLNNREFYYNRYIDECVTVKGPETCTDFQGSLNQYKSAVIEAEAANARGGKLPLQLKALDESLKKVKNARGR